MAGYMKITATPENAKVRLTLDLSKRLNAVVDEIAAENDSTKAEVLRTAIEFLEAAKEARREGLKVGAWRDKDGQREERQFIGL